MNSNELGVSAASATARAGGRAPPWLLWPRHGSPAEGIPALERRKKKEGSHASRLRRQKAVLFPVFQSAELIAAHKLLPICCWSLKCNNAHGYEEGASPPPIFMSTTPQRSPSGTPRLRQQFHPPFPKSATGPVCREIAGGRKHAEPVCVESSYLKIAAASRFRSLILLNGY